MSKIGAVCRFRSASLYIASNADTAVSPFAPPMILSVVGMEGLGLALDQRLGRRIALGDPRPLVEQPRHRVQRLEVELDELGAHRHQPLRGRPRRPPRAASSPKNFRCSGGETPTRSFGGAAPSTGTGSFRE